jgi:AraC family transcriptional regulator
MSTNVNQLPVVSLNAPRFEERDRFIIAGLSGRYTASTLDEIPALWEQFSAHIGKIPGQVGGVAYGVCSDMVDGSGSFQYLSGVQVSESSALPKQFTCLQIPAQRYVIFPHREHVSRLSYTVHAIWSQWFAGSGYKVATNDVAMLERYGEDFDPQMGMGDIEVWIPLV